MLLDSHLSELLGGVLADLSGLTLGVDEVSGRVDHLVSVGLQLVRDVPTGDVARDGDNGVIIIELGVVGDSVFCELSALDLNDGLGDVLGDVARGEKFHRITPFECSFGLYYMP